MLERGEIAWAEVDGVLVLVNLPSGAYQGLADAARDIWEAVLAAGSAEQAIPLLADVHDADDATVARDVRRLVDMWVQDGWLVQAEG